MNSDTTSIIDLPTDPTGGGNITNNISLTASENIMQSQASNIHMNANTNANMSSGQQPKLSLDQTTINQIINGLQHASVSGATQLPSRDIPMNVSNITQDPEAQHNYIPPPQNADYIKDYEDTDEIINSYNRNALRQDSLDEMYAEIQSPILLAVLYFLFQLPIFKKYLYIYFPILFSKDGNQNLYGYLFTSTLFGLIYYLLSKINTHFGTF